MKKTIICLLIFAVVSSLTFASNITFREGDKTVVLTTSQNPSLAVRDSFLEGFYDAYSSISKGSKLYEIYELIASKSFGNLDATQKNAYMAAFYECMTTYSAPSAGEFADLYPLYESLMKAPVSYSNSLEISSLGGIRFFSRLPD